MDPVTVLTDLAALIAGAAVVRGEYARQARDRDPCRETWVSWDSGSEHRCTRVRGHRNRSCRCECGAAKDMRHIPTRAA